jgi:hypothetical protein
MAWIFGSPRTGSTWLLSLLSHPLTLDRGHVLGFRVPAEHAGRTVDVIPVNESWLPHHLAPQILWSRHGDALERDLPPTLREELGSWANYFFAPHYEGVWRREVRRLILVRFQAVAARAADEGLTVAPNPVVVVKEVNGSHASDLTMTILARARLIFLIRDGRDVASSLLRANAPGGWLSRPEGRKTLTEPEARLAWFRGACRAWVGHMEVTGRAFDAHPPELRRMIRYEDLLADPPAVLEPLVQWLGLDRDAAWLAEAIEANSVEAAPESIRGPDGFVGAVRPGQWREDLTPTEQEIADELMGDKLAELGYER